MAEWKLQQTPPALRESVRQLTRAAVAAVCIWTLGCSSGKAPPAPAASPATATAPKYPPPPPLPTLESARCRVYSSEPGWQVFVDGNPVRDAAGQAVVTPCAVTAAPGTHTVAVARDGMGDLSQQVRFEGDAEAVFDTAAAAQSGESALLAAPLLSATPGTPVPLRSINTPERESDPFVTPDGRSLWFVAERAGTRGVYMATRGGPLEDFSEPKLLEMSRGSDLPATPSLTADEQSVIYVVPEKARVWKVTRSSPLADFDDRTPLYFTSAGGEQWLSAQITGDALRLYFVREAAGKTETRVVLREGVDAKFNQVLVVNMPGLHPCLSSDGLRQFVYDGTTLNRARRTALTSPFSEPEKVRDLVLEDYRHSPRHRQYFVTDDEQWLFYCDDPERGGDLYMVRLSEGPAWGVALHGAPIEPRAMVAAAPQSTLETPTEPTPTTPAPEEKPADPRSLFLAYTLFREALLKLVAERRFDDAAAQIAAARDNQELAEARELLDWDAADIAALQQLWRDVERAAAQLKPGDQFRDGSLRLEFVRYADGVLIGKARTREVERPLAKLDAASLVDLAERVAEPADPLSKLRTATLFAYDPDTAASTRGRSYVEAGDAGKQVAERMAIRLVRQAEWELARSDFARALEFIERIAKEHSGTDAATVASELREKLYTQYEWKRVGPRQWQTGPDGEYAAGAGREEGSVLLSPQAYSRFELTMEYRTTGATGQGGVFFRYRGTGAFYNRCFKIQLSNDKGVNPDPYCTGAIFSVVAPKENAAGNDGEWNTFRMQVDGEAVKVWINDRLVQETEAIDDQIPESGYLALDGIAGGIAYRRVVVSGEE